MKDLTKGNISRNLLLFAIPSIIAGVFTQALSIINKIMLGQFLGDIGLAASGSTGSFITTIAAAFYGMNMGFGLHLAYLSGCEDKKRLKTVTKTYATLLVCSSLLIMGLALVLQRPIFELLSVGEEIYEESRKYYLVYMCGFIFYIFNHYAHYFYISLGMSSYPMRISMGVGIGNVVLNFVFIVLMHMGAYGAALASVITSGIASVIYFIGINHELKSLSDGEKTRTRFRAAEFLPILRLAYPCIIQQFVMQLASSAVQPSINQLGTAAVAAYSVCLSIYSILTIMFGYFSIGLSSFCSQCIGQGNVRPIKKGLLISIVQAILFLLPVMLLIIIFPQSMTHLFLKNPVGESAMLVVRYAHLCVPFIFLVLISNIFHNFFRGVRKPIFAMITTSVYSAVRIISTFILSRHFAMDGVYFGFIVAWCIEAILCVILYISKTWKTEMYRAAEKTTYATDEHEQKVHQE